MEIKIASLLRTTKPLLCLFRIAAAKGGYRDKESGRRMQQFGPENTAMTFDEVSLERSKGFVQALQELKSLRPQLYSAADYCEKTYFHSEQKQMVLDNLKEYAVRALVNAIDHLGAVAYKLTEVSEQQSSDISTVELKISCLSQQILTCQTFTDKEGLRQQQFSSTTRRHKKHYILPSSIHERLESISNLQKDKSSGCVQSMPLPQSSGIPTPKTLSWHLDLDSNPAPSRDSRTSFLVGNSRAQNVAMNSFPSSEEPAAPMPLSSHLLSAKGNLTVAVPSHPTSVKWKQDEMEATKTSSGFKLFDKSVSQDTSHAPRNRSIFSAFFPRIRNKNVKPKRVPVIS